VERRQITSKATGRTAPVASYKGMTPLRVRKIDHDNVNRTILEFSATPAGVTAPSSRGHRYMLISRRG